MIDTNITNRAHLRFNHAMTQMAPSTSPKHRPHAGTPASPKAAAAPTCRSACMPWQLSCGVRAVAAIRVYEFVGGWFAGCWSVDAGFGGER